MCRGRMDEISSRAHYSMYACALRKENKERFRRSRLAAASLQCNLVRAAGKEQPIERAASGALDLVVIDVAVEADDDGADVLIVRQRVAAARREGRTDALARACLVSEAGRQARNARP
eukprot:6199494-Pleurochrysis_carterae.AAC.6